MRNSRQAAGLSLGPQGDLFEANVTVNVPIGSGLKVMLGKCGTPMGYESTFTEENFNWSGGNPMDLCGAIHPHRGDVVLPANS